MLPENSNANVNGAGEYDGLVIEFLQIHCEFEATFRSDEAAVSEWVQLDIVAVRTYTRRKAHQPEIEFTHIEIEESIPPGTIEKVEEILAESLFRVWLSEKRMVAR